jgi:L-iditol 2-dehydrogenase
VSGLDSLLEIPDSVTYEEATFVEPLADVIHSLVDQAKVHVGDKMVVLGAGQLGLQHLMLGKAMGVRVLVSDLKDERLQVAKSLGAEAVVNPTKADAIAAVKDWTGGVGPDAVIVAAGATQAVEQAALMVRKGGRVVLFAGFEYNKVIQIDPNLLHYGEVILTGSYWVGIRPHPKLELYQTALDLIASKQAPVADLITHRFPLSEIKQALELVMHQEGLKVMINIR